MPSNKKKKVNFAQQNPIAGNNTNINEASEYDEEIVDIEGEAIEPIEEETAQVNAEVIEEDAPVENTYPEHMYRVRLDWDKPNTQLIASPEIEVAIEEASKHPGYKVFIDDDGECVWNSENIEVTEVPVDDNAVKPVILPTTGGKCFLKNVGLYVGALSEKPYKYITGEFYYYDYNIFNGRARITKNKNITVDNKEPSMIYGYIDIE